MDALDLLEKQHREVRDLLDRLAAGGEVMGGEAFSREVFRALEAHVRVEEAYVYVACARKIRDEARVGHAIVEHARILGLSRSLVGMPPLGPRFSARLAALEELFVRHAEIEEDVVFPRLKRALTDEELDILGDEIFRAHGRLSTEELPRERPFSHAARGLEQARVRRGRGPRRPAPPSV